MRIEYPKLESVQTDFSLNQIKPIMTNSNSVANLVKRAGIKITKNFRSNYRFNGNKIDAEVYFNTDCEITYWTFWTEDLDCTEHEVQFRTKSDVMHYLLTLELN